MISSHNYNSNKSGKKLLVFGAIHGDEPCGTIAIKKVMQELDLGRIQLKSGSVTFVPICNPKAHKLNKRFTEKNLNRVFTTHKNPNTYEEILANTLTKYVDQCDVLLDIHSASADGPPNVFQDFLNNQNQQLAEATNIQTIIQGRQEIYNSNKNHKDFDTMRYINKKGKQGVVIECGQHSYLQAPKIGYKTIINILQYLGIIDSDKNKKSVEHINIHMQKLFHKEKSGKFSQKWKHGQSISEGEVIATYTEGEKLIMPYDGYIVLPKHGADIGEERFYIGK